MSLYAFFSCSCKRASWFPSAGQQHDQFHVVHTSLTLFSVFIRASYCPSAGQLHGQLDGREGRAERQLRGGKEGVAEGDGDANRAREQGSDAGQKGEQQCVAVLAPHVVGQAVGSLSSASYHTAAHTYTCSKRLFGFLFSGRGG